MRTHQPDVAQFRHAVDVENIARFHIPVRHAVRVEPLQRLADSARQPVGIGDGEITAIGNPVLEGEGAIRVRLQRIRRLHRIVEAGIILRDVENLQQMRVIFNHSAVVAKTGELLFKIFGIALPGDDFQCEFPPGDVLHEIDLSETAAPAKLQNRESVKLFHPLQHVTSSRSAERNAFSPSYAVRSRTSSGISSGESSSWHSSTSRRNALVPRLHTV